MDKQPTLPPQQDDQPGTPDLLSMIASAAPISVDRHINDTKIIEAKRKAATSAREPAPAGVNPSDDDKGKGNSKGQDKGASRPRKTKGLNSETSSKKKTVMPDFDPTTRDGRRGRLEWMVNHGVDPQARAAIKDLDEMDIEDNGIDPNAKADPAHVVAYLMRANLLGKSPAAVLLEQHGLRRIAKVVANSLGLDSVTLSLGENTEQYEREQQPEEASA